MCELFHFFDRLYLYCIGVHETFGSVIPRTKVGEADAKREHPPGVLAGSIHGRAYGIQSVFFCVLVKPQKPVKNFLIDFLKK